MRWRESKSAVYNFRCELLRLPVKFNHDSFIFTAAMRYAILFFSGNDFAAYCVLYHAEQYFRLGVHYAEEQRGVGGFSEFVFRKADVHGKLEIRKPDAIRKIGRVFGFEIHNDQGTP